MLRQSFAKKQGDHWVWIGKKGKQIEMRLRVSEKPLIAERSRENGKE